MAEYEVTGVRWQMDDGLTMEQRTQKAVAFVKALKEGTPLILAAEPDNIEHNEAIAVYKDFTHVGYIKRESCKEVKPLLNRDGQCDAVVSGNDGHVTFYVEIPDAPDVIVMPSNEQRQLPECPLPQGIGLNFSSEERTLQVIAPRLVKMSVSADTASAFLSMAERFMPLSRLSLCFEDDFWRDHMLKQLRKACRLELPEPEKERLEKLRDELKKTVGDFHRTHDHWQQKLFDQQLDLLRKQAESQNGLFAKYERYRENQPDIIESLVCWFDTMPYVELRNYKEHVSLAQRLSYLGVSRRELYEVYAAILLLEKFGGTTNTDSNSKTRATTNKKNGNKKGDGRPKTLKYYTHGNNSVLMKQHKRVDIMFRLWNDWGWIDDETEADDFDRLWEGVPRHCNITWKANSTILTILLQELIAKPYIREQTGQAARSMVEQQFGMTANSDRKNRLTNDDEQKICLTLLILDINNPLPMRRGNDGDEEEDTSEAALFEIFAGQLRMTKAV